MQLQMISPKTTNKTINTGDISVSPFSLILQLLTYLPVIILYANNGYYNRFMKIAEDHGLKLYDGIM